MDRLPKNDNLLRRAALLAGALLLAGCGSLPTINPDLALRRGEPVRVDGAHGSLSPERSKAVLDKLKQSGGDSGIFERHLALEQALSDTPLVAGNKVVLLKDGPATYRAMFAAIAGAVPIAAVAVLPVLVRALAGAVGFVLLRGVLEVERDAAAEWISRAEPDARGLRADETARVERAREPGAEPRVRLQREGGSGQHLESLLREGAHAR